MRLADGPAEEIVARPEEACADLLVMATHGYGAIPRALPGGRCAPGPVLLVPPRLWRQAPE
ncbi:MAG TPA: universal stress protein [Longimicrobium sp.]|nr:universal stress protein [Longimicrobium sp.]